MNLHKTFAIPHGGGGPGMGPIGLKAHLAPFMAQPCGANRSPARIWAKAPCLPHRGGPPRFCRSRGCTNRPARQRGFEARATEVAILNANYVASQLHADYPVLSRRQKRTRRSRMHSRYPTDQGRDRHCRNRYCQAPDGLRFPRADGELSSGWHDHDRADGVGIEGGNGSLHRGAMASIRNEIRKIEQGVWPADNNPLKNAPHTQADIVDAGWNRPYSREEAVFPAAMGGRQ